MIQTWTIQNFKSVSDKTTLNMKPLTIFAGPNSSGKSTLIQSILLVAQTLQTTVNSQSVVLNGHILRLGSFDDIIFNHQSDQTVLIGFGLTLISETESLQGEKGTIECDFAFSLNSDQKSDNRRLHPVLEESAIRSSQPALKIKTLRRRVPRNAEKSGIPSESPRSSAASALKKPPQTTIFSARKIHGSINRKLEKFCLKDNRLQKAETDSLQYEITTPRTSSDMGLMVKMIDDKTGNTDVSKGIAGASFSHFLPKALAYIYHEIEGELEQINCFVESKSMNLHEFEDISVKKSSFRFTHLPGSVYFAVENIQSYFNEHLKYLGPLREDPKPIYPLSDTMDSKDVGIRGEHTASVLNIHSNTRIEYIPSEQFAADEQNPCSKFSTLSDAVLDWLDYMGVVSNVKTAKLGNIGVELKVTLDNAFWHDLIHVGIGVSQVLPIVVSALLAEKGATLIFEQPELHLHPRVQTRLADFFLSMTILKKQCIVETHSEYLVNRLRYRSVMAEGDQVSD